MGYSCADCGDIEHTCTAWDGSNYPYQSGDVSKPNHNLKEKCPEDIETCKYRKKKIPSKPF